MPPLLLRLIVVVVGSTLLTHSCVNAQCSTQEAQFDTCPNAVACESCLVAAFDTYTGLVCSDWSKRVCPLLEATDTGCPCNGCQSGAEEWLDCLFVNRGCPFFCGFDGTETSNDPSAGTFTQTFAGWWYHLTFQTSTTCTLAQQDVEITCDDGHDIAYVSTTVVDDTITCEVDTSNASLLRCTDTNGVALGDPDSTAPRGVFYTCSGPALSGTSLSVLPQTADCNVAPNSGGVIGTHASIAATCGTNDNVSTDYFLECAAPALSNANLFDRYNCILDVDNPTTTVSTIDLPLVTARTNGRVVPFSQANGCYEFEAAAPSTPQPTRSPTAKCFIEQQSFQECFEKQCGDANACEQCMIDELDSFTASQCTDFSNRMCPAITNECPCNGCEKASERWLQCEFIDGCPFQCSFPNDPILESPVCSPTPGGIPTGSPLEVSSTPAPMEDSPSMMPNDGLETETNAPTGAPITTDGLGTETNAPTGAPITTSPTSATKPRFNRSLVVVATAVVVFVSIVFEV